MDVHAAMTVLNDGKIGVGDSAPAGFRGTDFR